MTLMSSLNSLVNWSSHDQWSIFFGNWWHKLILGINTMIDRSSHHLTTRNSIWNFTVPVVGVHWVNWSSGIHLSFNPFIDWTIFVSLLNVGIFGSSHLGSSRNSFISWTVLVAGLYIVVDRSF